MAVIRLLCLAAAPLVLIWGDSPYGRSDAKLEHIEQVDCITQFDAARKRVDLSPFKWSLESFNTLPSVGSFWDAVCAGVFQEGTPGATAPEPQAGTYAYMARSERRAECGAAAKLWESAMAKLGALPPVYTRDNPIYRDPVNTSFVALFNPVLNPTISCAIFTCTAPAPQANKQARGLLCLSSPPALKEGQAPYTQGEWAQITKGLTSAASAPVPALVVIAAAGLSIAILFASAVAK